MYRIFDCKGTVSADSEESYEVRFRGEGGIHFCDYESKILPVDERDYHTGRMSNLLLKYRDGATSMEASYLPLLTATGNLRKCFVQELSHLQRAAIRSRYTCTEDVVLIALKDIRMRMGSFDNTLHRSLNSIENKSFDSYFHMYLDAQCLFLSICHMLSKPDDFTDILNDIIEDMVMLAHQIFKKYQEDGDLKTNTPFICHCHRQLWLILAKICDSCKHVPESLFDKLSELLEIKWRSSNLFRLWLFRHLHNLDLYNSRGAYDLQRTTNATSLELLRSQYGYLQDTFNRITGENVTELLPALKLTYQFMTGTWMVNTSIIMYKTMWEYFYKNISTGAVEFHIPDTVTDLLSLRTRVISFTDPPIVINPHSELLVFMQMLMRHLHKFPDDWQKLKSRFYTRFLPARMSQLHVSAINTVAFIYLLLTEINLNELSTKLLSVLQALQNHTNQHVALWNFNMAVIILNIEKDQSIGEYAASFISLINTCFIDSRLYLVTKFVSHFKLILRTAKDPSKLTLHALIDSNWISTYMDKCRSEELAELISLLEMIVDLSEKDTPLWFTLEDSLRAQVLQQMEGIVSSKPEVPANIGVLASKLAIRFVEFKPSIIQFYTNDQSYKSCSMGITMSFLSDLLKSYPDKVSLSLTQERLLVQAWVRCMFISSMKPSTIRNTGCIFKLQSLSPLLPDNQEAIDEWALRDMRGRLRELILRSGNTKELQEIASHCFGSVDTTVAILLDQMHAYGDEKMELVRPTKALLEEVGSLIEDCGSLLLKVNEPGCKLERLLAVTLLSNNAFSSASVFPGWVLAVQVVWSKFYNGLRTVRAKMHQDKSVIDRMLHDMITRYVRPYSVEESPIVHTLFQNIDEELEYILSHLSGELNRFPLQESRQQVLNIIRYVYARIESTTAHRKEIVVRSTVPALLELMLNNEHLRTEAVSLLDKMGVNTASSSHLAITVESLAEITRSQLMFHGAQVLRLLIYLTPKLWRVVEGVLGGVERNIVEVERRQSIDRNNMLRNLLEDAQRSLAQYRH